MEYKDTIFLPKTSFEMRANLPLKEPKILEKWNKQKIYKQLREKYVIKIMQRQRESLVAY